MDNASYKQVSNYLANELGITRDFVSKLVGDRVDHFLKQALEARIENLNIEEAVKNALANVAKNGFKNGWYSNVSFDQYVKETVRDILKEEIQAKLKVEFK